MEETGISSSSSSLFPCGVGTTSLNLFHPFDEPSSSTSIFCRSLHFLAVHVFPFDISVNIFSPSNLLSSSSPSTTFSYFPCSRCQFVLTSYLYVSSQSLLLIPPPTIFLLSDNRLIESPTLMFVKNRHNTFSNFSYPHTAISQDATSDDAGGGLFSALGDKLKSLVRSNALAQNGHSCCPRPVGGLGFAKVVSNPQFPEHEFFRAGRVFCLRLRHNNLAFEDDAMLDGRVTCVKVCVSQNTDVTSCRRMENNLYFSC